MLKVVMYSSENIHSHTLRGLWKLRVRSRWGMAGRGGVVKPNFLKEVMKPL